MNECSLMNIIIILHEHFDSTAYMY